MNKIENETTSWPFLHPHKSSWKNLTTLLNAFFLLKSHSRYLISHPFTRQDILHIQFILLSVMSINSCFYISYLFLICSSSNRFWCHFDDDNYVNIPTLVKLLNEYPAYHDWYLGKPSISSPIEMYLNAVSLYGKYLRIINLIHH